MDVMTRRFFCEHGKVQMTIVEPQDGDDARYRKLFRAEVAKGARWASGMDRVGIEVARQSDMQCGPCDAERRSK
jgi:hypothetical protein